MFPILATAIIKDAVDNYLGLLRHKSLKITLTRAPSFFTGNL